MDFVFRAFFLQFLVFGLLVSHVRPQTGGTDCHGKDYLCLDDVRFQLCVDYGDGKPTTVNDEVQNCPQGTFCSNSGHYECDSFVPPSTTAEPHVNVDDDATAQPETEENATNEPVVEVEDATLPAATDAPASNPATEGANDDDTPANPEASGPLDPVEVEVTTVEDVPAQESSTPTVETATNEVPEEEVAVPSEGTALPEQSETTVAPESVPAEPEEESAPSTSGPEAEAVETTSQSNNPEAEESPVETTAPVEPEATNPPAAEESTTSSPEETTVAQETEPEPVATDAPEVEVGENTESVVTTEQTVGSESSGPAESEATTVGEAVEQSSTDAAEAVTTEESLPSEQPTESEVPQDSSTVAATEAPGQEETEVPADDSSVAPETTAQPETGEQEGSEVDPSEPSVVPEVPESTSEPSAQPDTPESTSETEAADTTLAPEVPESSSDPSVEAPEAPESSSVSSEPSETTAPVTENETTTTVASSPNDEDSSSSDPNTNESGSNEGSASQDSTEAPSAESGAESNEGTGVVPQAPGSSPFVCPAAGRFANPTDCHKYYVCFWLPFGLYSLEQNCLTGYAYNPTLERCTADQSVCFPGQFTCMGPGRFPDPTDPTQYFWCVWNTFGGYLQYKMQCPMGQVFNPFRGRCAFVVAGTRSLPLDELDDGELVAGEESTPTEDVVVEPTQPAEPVAPVEDQPKLKVKFQCLEEGTFADPNNCSRYFVCTLKKLDKFKKSKFKCVTGERFDPLVSACVPDVDALCE
ncbi:mucin-5AC-like [Anopheles moucheti]|uniref:mucin-5AC-like n=1 Tax=Anopheles moucheti TaxID=186751 RepID=UPI0022F013A8|nr:mucin-5AC-like [Anopheles moucheti]